MNTTLELIASLPVQNTLGEGVVWNHITQTVWWTDIQESRLYSCGESGESLKVWETPDRLTAFGFIDGSENMIAAFARGIAIYHPEKGIIHWLKHSMIKDPNIRFNDGRVDNQGRFWVGTMVENMEPEQHRHKGQLFHVDHNLALHAHQDGISISNGLCWSPDSTKMYHADSPTQAIKSFDFDPVEGLAVNPTEFVKLTGNTFPDGSVTDAQGNLFNAQWGGASIKKYSFKDDDILSEELPLPVTQPTCLAFGGKDLDLIFVTSAKEGLGESKQKLKSSEGNLLIYKSSMQGRNQPFFNLSIPHYL